MWAKISIIVKFSTIKILKIVKGVRALSSIFLIFSKKFRIWDFSENAENSTMPRYNMIWNIWIWIFINVSKSKMLNYEILKSHYDILSETDTFRPNQNEAVRLKTFIPEQGKEIPIHVAQIPKISTKSIPAKSGVGKSSVWKMSYKDYICPYHSTPVQNLVER